MGDRIELIFKEEFMRVAVQQFLCVEAAERLWKALKLAAEQNSAEGG